MKLEGIVTSAGQLSSSEVKALSLLRHVASHTDGGVEVRLHSYGHFMEVGSQLYSPVAFPTGQVPPAPFA